MLQKALENIGMKPVEAKVYLATLKLGTQDVKTIAKETGIAPKETAGILSDLLDRGFVSKFSSEKDFFTPERPDIILKILENKKHRMEEQILTFSKILPQFDDFINPAFTKPEIAFYEGEEGLIAAYEDTLTAQTDILAIASVDDIQCTFPEYMLKYYKRRKAAGILIRAIFPDSEDSRERITHDTEELRISRLIPKDVMDFRMEWNIYDDKIAHFSLEEKLAVIVKSKVISDGMRNVFELCWKMADMYQGEGGTPPDAEEVQKTSTPSKARKKKLVSKT